MTLEETLFAATYRIRRVEETIAALYPSDVIRSPIHLSLGQEAVSVGVCAALRQTDKVFGSYRCHALYLAKGGDLKAMLAELYGKATGCCGGWGGSMHLVDPAAGLIATSAVVASTIPLAVGYAYAEKIRGRDTVVACFFGDGAAEEGAFHEALNFAALHQLRVLFVCEDNDLAIHVPRAQRQAARRVGDHAAAYRMPVVRLNLATAADPAEVYAAARMAVDGMRRAAAPVFLECAVIRWAEHVGPGQDWHLGYREKPADLPDSVAIAGARVKPVRRAELEAEVEAEVVEAVRFGEGSPWPK